MTRKHGRILSVCLMLLFLIAFYVSPATTAEMTEEAKRVVDTTTDKNLVTSPFSDVVSRVSQSVVGINNYSVYTYRTRRSFSASGQYESVEQLAATGSGVIVYDKYILTNYHVVEGASRLTVNVSNDSEEIEATVAAYDSNLDLAIVYCEDLTGSAAPLGDSDMLQVGEWAICIGNPLSEELRGTVTIGIVSALDREIASSTTTDRYGLKTTEKNTMIQTDAAINSGNSGGGMFNVLGQLMGIPTMKYSGGSQSGATIEGIGLAIPVNSAKELIRRAISEGLTDENVNVKAESAPMDAPKGVRLGVTASAISAKNNEAVYYGYLPSGVMIAQVEKDSPAEKAGLMPDDVIVEADGNVIADIDGLTSVIKGKNAGDTIKIKLYRATNLDTAENAKDIKGEYMTMEVMMFAF